MHNISAKTYQLKGSLASTIQFPIKCIAQLRLAIVNLVVIHRRTYSLYNSSVFTATSNANFPWFAVPTWEYTRTLIPVWKCKITMSTTKAVLSQDTMNMVYDFTIRCMIFHIIKQSNNNCHQICRHYWRFLIWNCLQMPIHFFFNDWHVGKSY